MIPDTSTASVLVRGSVLGRQTAATKDVPTMSTGRVTRGLRPVRAVALAGEDVAN